MTTLGLELTKEILKDLRDCKDLSLFHNYRQEDAAQTFIRVNFEDIVRGNKIESSKEYLVADSYVHGERARNETVKCFAHIDKYDYEQQYNELSSVLAFLKVGDRIRIEWYRDAWTNQYMQHSANKVNSDDCSPFEALHGDAVYIVIYRGENTRYRFHLDHSICADNSARMIRDVEYKLSAF